MADVLVHLVDASNPMWRKQKAAVDSTLEDMGMGHKPRIVLFNKMDALSEEELEAWSDGWAERMRETEAGTGRGRPRRRRVAGRCPRGEEGGRRKRRRGRRRDWK
ncbi:gtp-binding protein [Nannochloropsis gaditana]|uniref:Gtp-binding protein n=1 Tax=Nannochloropsis gaditana TaxID=72520 RepID=W7TQ35_9STRA|nr:gtp-binding protein [Nannochloropsis gaditana]